MNTTRAFLGVSSGVAMAAWLLATPTACSSSNTDSGNATPKEDDRDKAHNFYVDRVHAGIDNCITCHSGGDPLAPRFMAPGAEESYTALERSAGLIAAPKNSPLVQYIHKDPLITVTPDQRSLLTAWLGLEANARSLEGAVERPKSVTEAYKQYADCMNFDVWTFYRMGDLAFAQTDAEGPCSGCHSTGQGSAWISAAGRETFEKARQFPYIQKFVVGKLDARGSFESLLPSKRFQAKAEEVCPPESTSCHPRFGLPPAVLGAIDGFVATTLQNLATGQCANGIVVPIVDAGPKDAGDGGPL